MSCAKTAKLMEMSFAVLTRVGPRNILDGVDIPHRKGQFCGLSGPLKSDVCSKKGSTNRR